MLTSPKVHLKARNYPCPQCDGAFARKDTLRRYVVDLNVLILVLNTNNNARHVDDGCPKRPEVKKRVANKVPKSTRSRPISGTGRPSASRTSPSPLKQLQAALAQVP